MAKKIFFSYDFDHPQLKDWFVDIVRQLFGDEFEVVVAEESRRRKSYEIVTRRIRECDAFFCVFTHDNDINSKTNRSVPSNWVVSESTYASSIGKPIMAIRDKSIQLDDIGLAIQGDFNVPPFNISEYRKDSKKVEGILKDTLKPKTPFRTKFAHKIVHVRRDGWVHCTMRYKTIVFKPEQFLKKQHAIWRTSRDIDIKSFVLNSGHSDTHTYLYAERILDKVNQRVKVHIAEDSVRSVNGNHVDFDLIFSEGDIKPFEEIEYEFNWGYQSAFFGTDYLLSNDSLHGYNSAGLRAGSAGQIERAKFDLIFERLPGGNEVCERTPNFAQAIRPRKEGETLLEYWSTADAWSDDVSVNESVRRSSNRDVLYSYDVENFFTTIKASWVPSEDYHLESTKRSIKITQKEIAEKQLQLLDHASDLIEEGKFRAIVEGQNVCTFVVTILCDSNVDNKVREVAIEILLKYASDWPRAKSLAKKLHDTSSIASNKSLFQSVIDFADRVEAKFTRKGSFGN